MWLELCFLMVVLMIIICSERDCGFVLIVVELFLSFSFLVWAYSGRWVCFFCFVAGKMGVFPFWF
ncbi:MAG: hypothetical protein FD143_2928 [Ignavibacteria bacterium]|nr:MAG: hypothetical protein FD143_2928 [Ignavibacteria bacterium]